MKLMNVLTVLGEVLSHLSSLITCGEAFRKYLGHGRINRLRRLERKAARRVREDRGVRLRRWDRLSDAELDELLYRGRPPDDLERALIARKKHLYYVKQLCLLWEQEKDEDANRVAAAQWQRPFSLRTGGARFSAALLYYIRSA